MELQKILKENWYSLTKERIDIFEYIKNSSFFNANDLLNRFCDIWRASVFRIINLFLKLGIIRRINLWDKIETYEYIDEKSHNEYIKCRICWSVIPFECNDICKKIVKEAEKKWFKVEEHSIWVFWVCQNCK